MLRGELHLGTEASVVQSLPQKQGNPAFFQSSVLQDAAPSEPSAPSTALAESTIGKFLPR